MTDTPEPLSDAEIREWLEREQPWVGICSCAAACVCGAPTDVKAIKKQRLRLGRALLAAREELEQAKAASDFWKKQKQQETDYIEGMHRACSEVDAEHKAELAALRRRAETAEAKQERHIDSLRESLNVAEVEAGMHVGTCDWGDCDLPTVTIRMSRDHGRLPVCIFHSEAYEMLATENTLLYERAEAAELEAANGRGALYVLNRKIEEERTKTRAAEAACAALREALAEVAIWIDDPTNTDGLPTDTTILVHEALAQPNPGAGMLERLVLLEALAVAARDMGGIDMGSYEDVPITDFDAVKQAVEAYDAALAQAGEEQS